MSEQHKAFHELFLSQVEKLDLYTNAITRAHGDSHPEAFEVRELFEKINEKLKNTESTKPDLQAEFAQLRKITDNYKIPDDVCETYAGTYEMLEEIDKAYEA